MVTLRNLLTTFSDKELDLPVVLSNDAEGNSFSPLASFSIGKYVTETTWRGEFHDEEDNPDLWEGYPDDSIRAICFWPVN